MPTFRKRLGQTCVWYQVEFASGHYYTLFVSRELYQIELSYCDDMPSIFSIGPLCTSRAFRFGRRFTATHAKWFPDCVVNWFIDTEEAFYYGDRPCGK